MFVELIDTLGPWSWVIFGLILLGIEILAPSTFLLWPGLSALVVGLITLVLGVDNTIWPWQAQLLVFLVLSLVIAYFGRQLVRSRKLEDTEQPNLNERGAQLVGRKGVLTSAIENGQGRAKLGDTTWTVRGSDIAEGEAVVVVAVEGNALTVKKA